MCISSDIAGVQGYAMYCANACRYV